MIDFKEKIFIVFIQVVCVIGLTLPPLNFIIAYDLAKKYKDRSDFASKCFIEVANFNLVCILYLVFSMLIIGLIHITTSYQFETDIKNLAKVILALWIVFYFIQMIFGVLTTLRGKKYKYKVWPKLLSLK